MIPTRRIAVCKLAVPRIRYPEVPAVLDMINAAGGFSKQARKSDVVVRRVVDGKVTEIKVPKELTMRVEPNDTIEVPRRRW